MINIILKFFFIRKKKLSIILQDEISECGLACINMICNYLGHDISMHILRLMNPSSIKGTSLLNLIELCESLNLRTKVLRIEMDELNKIQQPAILHWNMNHFVVLKKIKNRKVIIHDPAVGLRKCSFKEVSDFFTGIVLEVSKNHNFEPLQNKKKLHLAGLIKNINGIKRVLCVLITLSLLIEVLGLISPMFIQYITDYGIKTGDLNNLFVIAMGFAIVLSIQIFSEYIRSNFVLFVKNNFNEQFTSNLFMHLLKLPLNFFITRHKGDIQSKFNSIDQIYKKFSIDFVNTLLDGLMIIFTCAVMFIYSSMLTFMILISLLLFVSITIIFYKFLKRYTEESLRWHAISSSLFLETMQAMLSIKSFGKEANRYNIWHNNYIQFINSDIKISKINIFYTTTIKILQNLEYIIVLYVAASLIIKNQFSIGMLVAYLAYRLLLLNKTKLFVQNVIDYKMISIYLTRLSDIVFHHPEEIKYSSCEINMISGALTISDLSFKYNNEEYILKNFNLKINAGEKIVITGASGCGKTTLLKILMGLLKPNDGEIFIDDVAMSQFGLINFRKITASVMQDDSLMRGSLLQNIAFFDNLVNLDLIYESAKLAQIHDEILKLPMGYETLVGDMGSVLSGGQKQRLLLARALYKKPKILFLDEATSHLDNENEKKINAALKDLSITQVIIAHRKETISMADRIIYLD